MPFSIAAICGSSTSAGIPACSQASRSIDVSVLPGQRDALERNLESHHFPHRRGRAVHVYAVAAAQKRAVDIEQYASCASQANPSSMCSPRFVVLLSCLHADAELGFSPGVSLACGSKYRTFAAWRTLEPGANFRQADAQFGHRAAERVAVDTQLFCSLALVSLVAASTSRRYCLLNSYGILITNAGGMHLCYQAVQVSSHVNLLLY